MRTRAHETIYLRVEPGLKTNLSMLRDLADQERRKSKTGFYFSSTPTPLGRFCESLLAKYSDAAIAKEKASTEKAAALLAKKSKRSKRLATDHPSRALAGGRRNHARKGGGK